MKPTSIIALIVAVALVICGFITCTIAKGMAESDGNSLFAEKRGDDFVNTVSLSDIPINALDLTLNDTSIYIHGQSDNAYAEIINFNDNNYNLTTTSQVLTFKEVPDLLSMLKFWENGFSFKGMRYIFNPRQPSGDDERSVHIYLGTTDTKIGEITIHAENCDVHIDNVSTASEFNLFLDNCNLSLDTVSLTDELAIVGEDITIDAIGCIFDKIGVQSTDLMMDLTDILVSTSSEIRFATGVVNIDLPQSALTGSNISLQAQNGGTVTVNGNMVGSGYSREDDGVNWSIIATDGGDISISDSNS